uniref:V(D)J recombination-activating protein 2 n=1 Tax=Cyprinus carpio TaxID=7962 RepID=A0A8C2EK29_CYPCA
VLVFIQTCVSCAQTAVVTIRFYNYSNECPTGIFGVRIKKELKLRAISFSNNSSYLPPLRCPAIAHFEAHDGSPECYLIYGGQTPNNKLSSSLYMLSIDCRGCNQKVALRCPEKELVGDVPSAQYGHTLSEIHSRGKNACILFGGRSYMSPTKRTTENWDSVVDFWLLYGPHSRMASHIDLAREDCVYFLGTHILSSDCRPPRLIHLRVELLLGSPVLTCTVLPEGLAITSAIVTRVGYHEYIVFSSYQSETQKHMECTYIGQDDVRVHMEPREPPQWTSEITHSHIWFGGSLGKGSALIAIPSEGNPLEYSSDGEGDTYNEEDEEDESQTGYWIKCCLTCEGGHWVHAQCMELPESLLLCLSQDNSKYFCLDHGELPKQEMTPLRQMLPVKRVPMKMTHRKAPVSMKMTPAKKSFLQRLFD